MGKINLNLRGKILAIATAVILFAVGAVVATSTSLASGEYENALQSRSLAIGKSLSIQLERLLQFGIPIGDIIGFEGQCQEVVRTYSGIDLALVVDLQGKVLFSSDKAPPVGNRLLEAVKTGVERIINYPLMDVDRYNAIIPVRTPDGQHVASVIVSFPKELITDQITDMLLSDLLVAVLVLAVGLLVLYSALITYVTRPLSSLISTVVSLRAAPHDLGRRTSINSSDELGQLSRAFNSLMDELQHTTVSKGELESAMDELQRLSGVLFEQKEHAEVTLRSIGDAVLSVNAQEEIRYLNPVAERLTGWSLDEAIGRSLKDVLHLVDAGFSTLNPFYQAFERHEATSNNQDVELLHKDGTAIGVNYIAVPMHDASGNLSGGVLTLRDVSAERRMSQRLLWEASHDPLTGLVNRREFTNRLEAALATAKNSGEQHVVCFLDLDRFKVVNDTAGHAAGDELLKVLSGMLRECIRQADTLARLGGDEFALLLENCSLERGQLIANDLLEAMDAFRFDTHGKVFTLGVSIGIAPAVGDASCADVLSMADTACYIAKEQGRNRVCVYRTDNSDLAARRRETDWVTRINAALAEDRFILYHQTYLALGPEAEPRTHLEVLIRMIDEGGNLVQPMSFIPAAERYNLMPAIDRWVIRNVFAGYHTLVNQRNGQAVTCAINLSGTSLNSGGLFNFIREQAQVYAIPPNAICFEITETAAINNLRSAADFVNDCKSLGFLFALDDFGTGTSSFGYLKNLAVDYLKIDGGFVRNMEEDGIDRAMTETINRIGQIMGIRTIAEYAENQIIIDHLRAMGVTYAQGYGVSRPAPLFAHNSVG